MYHTVSFEQNKKIIERFQPKVIILWLKRSQCVLLFEQSKETNLRNHASIQSYTISCSTGNNHNNCIVFNLARWCRGFVQVSTPRGPAGYFSFSRRGDGYIFVSYLTLKHGLWVVLHTFFVFFFYSCFDEIHVHVCKDGRKVQALVDGVLGHTYRHRKHSALVICNQAPSPSRGW